MKKLIPFTLLAMLLTSGVASADRRGRDHRRGDDHGQRGDHWRGDDRAWRGGDRDRDHRRVVARDRRHHVDRSRRFSRPIFRDGSFHFHGGIVKRWRRPVITHRYINVHVQPAPVAEQYDAVSGYVWHPGQWQWTGYEWSWTAGYYDVDANYGYNQGYDYNGDGYADQGGYDYNGDGYADQAPAPAPYPY